MTLPPDPTLDEIRDALAPIIARHAAFDGWSGAAVDSAAAEAGVDPAIVRLAFDGGPMTMIDAWFASIDRHMLEAHPPEQLAALRVSERITALVEARLALMERQRESLRRAHAILSLPQNLLRAMQLGWRSADVMWRAAGDTSTDFNHYTKRSLLSAIYTATLLVFLDDESEGHADTRAFLARRIAGIGRFEKAKARFRVGEDQRISLSRFLGRLRYPATR